MLTPPRNVQQRDIVARGNDVELVLAQRVSNYFGSTISPLATVRHSLATMAGLPDGNTINGMPVPSPTDPHFAQFVHNIICVT
eukprot:5869935-Amphidinium_carterae.1